MADRWFRKNRGFNRVKSLRLLSFVRQRQEPCESHVTHRELMRRHKTTCQYRRGTSNSPLRRLTTGLAPVTVTQANWPCHVGKTKTQRRATPRLGQPVGGNKKECSNP